MVVVIKLGKKIISIVYYFIKKYNPIKENKVLFLSRQSNTLSLDFLLLENELINKTSNKIEIKYICNRLDDSKKGIIKFIIDSFKSMYHLATSKVCVLDSYWPIVSICKHKKELTIIQMWHSIGKIKKSGHQTIGKPSGRSEEISNLLCMHQNYDIIISSAESWNPFYLQSFNTSLDKLYNIGLPRIDYLLRTNEFNKERILDEYPFLKEKKVILYAPTFRRNIIPKWEELLDYIDFDKYFLIVKSHPNQKINTDNPNILTCPEFSAVRLLSVCEYLITDYSAIAVEAAILNKKTYYYLYDYDEYLLKNGVNVDPFYSMPGCAFKNAKDLIIDLESGNYNQNSLDNYREKYLPKELGTSTAKLAQLVLDKLS